MTQNFMGEGKMLKTTLKIEGMMCGMCESHINATIRQKFPVRKVISSLSKGETVILSEQMLNESSGEMSSGK